MASDEFMDKLPPFVITSDDPMWESLRHWIETAGAMLLAHDERLGRQATAIQLLTEHIVALEKGNPPPDHKTPEMPTCTCDPDNGAWNDECPLHGLGTN